MVKPHIEAIFMADTKVEFSQLSKLYSEAKLKYPYLAYDIEQLHETEQKIYEYSVQIQDLEAQKLDTNFNSLLNSGVSNQNKTVIDDKIKKLRDEISVLQGSTLFQRKNELETASNELDSYLKEVNTNLDFQRALREALVERHESHIDSQEKSMVVPKKTLAIISRLENLAKNDPELQVILNIDKDKQELSFYENVIAQQKSIKSKDPKEQAERDAGIKFLERQKADYRKGIKNKGFKLCKYIDEHRKELGIPSHEKIDFNDSTSPLYFISEVTWADSPLTLSATKELFTDAINRTEKNIESTKQCLTIANKEILELKNKREEELQDLSLYPKKGILSTLGRIAKGTITGIKNFFYGNKHPFKGVYKKPPMPKAPSRSSVVDTNNNFLDAYKTEIGQDVIEQILQNHKKQVEEQRQSGSRQNNSQDGRTL